MSEHIILGRWTEEGLEHLLRKSSEIRCADSRINFISRQFLNTRYKESTLIGDRRSSEVFVINLEGVDCFTFIEYVEAMRLSRSFRDFRENLKKVRYRSGRVAFESRNHFFTDWREFNPDFVYDVTERVGARKTESTLKTLNKKEDGSYFLPGIQPAQRLIKYIPSDAVDDSVISRLWIGDYAGIYSTAQGIDVSHVGIIIREEDSIYLRHASPEKKYGKVVDREFRNYISDKPGLVVLRPKD